MAEKARLAITTGKLTPAGSEADDRRDNDDDGYDKEHFLMSAPVRIGTVSHHLGHRCRIKQSWTQSGSEPASLVHTLREQPSSCRIDTTVTVATNETSLSSRDVGCSGEPRHTYTTKPAEEYT